MLGLAYGFKDTLPDLSPKLLFEVSGHKPYNKKWDYAVWDLAQNIQIKSEMPVQL